MASLGYDDLRTTSQQRNLVRLLLKGQTRSEAAATLGVSKQRTTQLVQQLEVKGLMTRIDGKLFVSINMMQRLVSP